MDINVTLKSIFVNHKDDLVKKLENLSLPKDSQQVQKIVSNYLNNLFENDGDFRQNLTESEDYILQSALRLLQAQQNIVKEISKSTKQVSVNISHSENESQTKITPYIPIVGAGLGAVAGGVIGTWGAVAGAIAGTALVVYCSSGNKKNKTIKKSLSEENANPTINIDVFCSIVEGICEGIDEVVDTYRIQVKRIVNTYEQREQPSLLNTYSSLMEQIANVISVSKTYGTDLPVKLRNAIGIMEDCLENYDVKYEGGKIINI